MLLHHNFMQLDTLPPFFYNELLQICNSVLVCKTCTDNFPGFTG